MYDYLKSLSTHICSGTPIPCIVGNFGEVFNLANFSKVAKLKITSLNLMNLYMLAYDAEHR